MVERDSVPRGRVLLPIAPHAASQSAAPVAFPSYKRCRIDKRTAPAILRAERAEAVPANSSGPDFSDLFGVWCTGPGTLNVETPGPRGPAPFVLWYTTGNYAGLITRPGPGAVAIPVRARTYRILVSVLDGAPSQQFHVTTALR